MPVRDEDWILEHTLADLSEYVDEIVAVDDGSTDRTPEILRSFPKVTAIHTNPPGTKPFGNGQESDNRNKTLDLARERKADWVLQIDADEVFEDRMKAEVHNLMALGCSTRFRILHFWNDTMHFRTDDKWGDFYRFSLFRLRRRLRFSPQHLIAKPRAFDRKNKYTSDVNVLHYGWISPRQRERSLERYYSVYKTKYPDSEMTFEEFKYCDSAQKELKIVSQNEKGLQVTPWSKIMSHEDPERYQL